MIWSTEPSGPEAFYKKVFVQRAVGVWSNLRLPR